jgi:anaerobic selenocysteine-containing dehydrogenase
MLEALLQPSGLDWEGFVRQGMLKGSEWYRHYEGKGFATLLGKVELELSAAKSLGVDPLPMWIQERPEPDEDYPLVLTSAKSPNYLHSSYRWVDSLRKREPQPTVQVHPDTAIHYGVEQGQNVWIETSAGAGATEQQVEVTEQMQPGVLCAAHGWWFPEQEGHRPESWQTASLSCLTTVQDLGR